MRNGMTWWGTGKCLACAAAAVALSVSLPILPPFLDVDAATATAPEGRYEYTIHGTGGAGDPYYSRITSFESSGARVTVQPALEGYPVTEISADSFRPCAGMTDLVLPATLLSVGDGALASCSSLERVYFLGDKPSIGAGAIPSRAVVHRLSGTGGWGGEAVLQLHTHDGPGFSIGYYVIGGKATVHSLLSGTAVSVPRSLGGHAVEGIGNEAFRGSPVTSVEMDDAITKIGVRAFYKCGALETAALPSSLETIGDEAFRECGRLGNVDLRNPWYIGFESFRMCRAFTEVAIPDSVTALGEGAFRVCSDVERLVVGTGITSIGDWAFDHYDSLETVEFRGKVAHIGEHAFFAATKLEGIALPHVETVGTDAFGGCRELRDVAFGDRLRELGPGAFGDCKNLREIRFPETLERVGDGAFMGAIRLEDARFDGPMPAFGENVFADTDPDFKVHVREAHSESWSGFDGRVVVHPDGDGDSAIYAIAAAAVAAAAIAVVLLARGRSGR